MISLNLFGEDELRVLVFEFSFILLVSRFLEVGLFFLEFLIRGFFRIFREVIRFIG